MPLKNILFPEQIGLPLANASKIYRMYGTGNAEDVPSLYIGKPDINPRKV
jgi:hypothetical protein